jgi:acylphosphatase
VSDEELSRANCVVTGSVQAVGFRWWVSRQADRLDLVGRAVNEHDGSVGIVVQGSRPAVDEFVQLLRERPSTTRRPGTIGSVEVTYDVPDRSLRRFSTG